MNVHNIIVASDVCDIKNIRPVIRAYQSSTDA